MDPIADMITNLRNSFAVNKPALIPVSKLKLKILEVMKQEGYIGELKAIKTDPRKIEVKPGQKAVDEVKRISKPGRRLYIKAKGIKIKPGALVILSTPAGVLTAAQARRQHVGGEVLFEVRS